MEKGIEVKKAVIIGIVVLVILIAGAYFFFLRGEKNGGGGEGNGTENRSPVADAGPDITVRPGENFNLSGAGSSDPDDDELVFFYWDMDDSKDSNGDGIMDNDKDRQGINITYYYPVSPATITYTVTLSVSDGDKLDNNTVRVTVLIENEQLPPPIMDLGVNYYNDPFGISGGPHFIITVQSVTREEFFINYTYALEDTEGTRIREGTLEELINISSTAEMRFIDTPRLTYLEGGDSFTLKEGDEIVEHCVFYLYYLYEVEAAGSIELVK